MHDPTRRRRLALPLLLLLLLPLLACGSGRAAPSSWVVTELRGAVTRAGKPLALLDTLAPGDSLALAPGAFVAAWPAGGALQYVAAGPGLFAVRADALVLREGAGSVHASRAGRPGAAPPTAHSTMAGAIMRAGLDAAVPEPVAPSRPYFRWPVRPRRGPWIFRLRDEAGALLHEARVDANEYEPPAAVLLEPGRLYYRELAWDDGRPAPRVDSRRFRTLDAGDDRELAALAPPADAGAGADGGAARRIAYGLALRRLGVLQLARRVAPELF